MLKFKPVDTALTHSEVRPSKTHFVSIQQNYIMNLILQ
jgi:hypothetical protein